MKERRKSLLKAVGWLVVYSLGIAFIAVPLLFALGCAGAATSTITPAKSTAENKVLQVTAPSKRRTTITITTPPAAGVAPAPVEEDIE